MIFMARLGFTSRPYAIMLYRNAATIVPLEKLEFQKLHTHLKTLIISPPAR